MKRQTKSAGMTLVEILLATAAAVVAGLILFSVMHGVLVLSAKNAAVNLTHQQVRQMIHRTVDEIRESASMPQLIDVNRVRLPVGSNGPAAGVAFQSMVGGPYRVWNNTAANTPNIRILIRPEDPPPEPGMRLIIPSFRVEADIVAVGGFPGEPSVRNIQLATNVGVNIICLAGDPVYLAYFTKRTGIVVVDGELRRYPDLAKDPYTVTARNVETPQPFSVPAGDNRFIKVNLFARDSRVSQRGYKAIDLKLSLNVPYRFGLTTRQ